MTNEAIIANAKLVLPSEVIHGALVLRCGKIAQIDHGTAVPAGAFDCGGHYLAPGLIELHTDNLERHMQPRPGVDWPRAAAIIAHDAELAGAGITSVFDAIRVGSITSDGGARRYGKYARAVADDIIRLRMEGSLRISHRIHLRAELCSETLIDELDEFGPADQVGIVSLMDHTPGQRQFRDLQKFEDYVCKKNDMPREGFEDYITFLRGLQDRLGARHEAAAVAAAARYGAVLASHDDTTAGQVAHSHKQGVTLAEFPTTLEAAQACHAKGIATIMGAPNLVRGASHSGNVAARELAEQGRLDILSSDYVPGALLQGALRLADLWGDMAAGLATVTARPAACCGLRDRGTIMPGRRADLLLFEHARDVAIPRAVWSRGVRVA